MALSLGLGLGLTRNTGVGAAAYAPYVAPAGYRWDFVTYNGARVTYNAEPVVALIGA
jgi:hypothetical protein